MNDAQFDRFHNDVDAVARHIENCDRLVKMAVLSLRQIDQKIADAVETKAQAHQIAQDAGSEARQATLDAVTELIGAMGQATDTARKSAATLDIVRFRMAGWIALYVALTLLCCVATGYITAWALRGNAITPEQAAYIELGKAHEALMNRATDRELKTISKIRSRVEIAPAKEGS